MAIVVDIDVMLALRKMAVGTLAELVGITPANLSVLKNGRAKAIRFTTFQAICKANPMLPLGDGSTRFRWMCRMAPMKTSQAHSGRSREGYLVFD